MGVLKSSSVPAEKGAETGRRTRGVSAEIRRTKSLHPVCEKVEKVAASNPKCCFP